MDAFVELMIDWGYVGMFISAVIAGSVIPFSSELVFAGLIYVGLDPVLCVVSATLGNTIGSMTIYCVGCLGKVEWMEKYFHVKREKVERMHSFLQHKGALMGFFAFLPLVGSVISAALGFMRSNLTLTVLSMMTGKALRYIILVLTIEAVF